MADVLDYCVMADQSKGLAFSRQTHGWEGVAFDALSADKWTRMKTALGWPWDRKLYDKTLVYDWVTEQDWTSPKDYKKFVNQRPGAPLPDGIAMFPRYIPDTFFRSRVCTLKAQTQFKIFKNCAWDNVYHDVGDVEHLLFGPYQIDHLGDVGVQPTLVHHYFWNGSGGVYSCLEENLYALNYGWVRWSLSNLVNGIYTASGQQSIHNKLVKITVPPVNFPCF